MKLLRGNPAGVVPVYLFLLLILVLILPAKSITDTEKQQIEKGLQTGSELLKIAKEQNFQEATKLMVQKLSPYLSALGPFVGFVMTFVPSESAELGYMKEMMSKIDERFTQVDNRLVSIEQKIDWADAKIKLGDVEQDIWAMDDEYIRFYNSSASSETRSYKFRTSYESTYDLAGTKLYNIIVNENGLFNDDLGHEVMAVTENDRGETQVFLLRVIDLIMQAQRIETAYDEIIGDEVQKSETIKIWGERVKKIQSKFDQIDIEVKELFANQSRDDILKYARANSSKYNLHFSLELYAILSLKFYWRDWFVLVYNSIVGDDKHMMKVCYGGQTIRQHDHYMVVASKDKTDIKMNKNAVQADLMKFSIETHDNFFTGRTHMYLNYDKTRLGFPDAGVIFSYVGNKYDVYNACCVAVVKSDEAVYHNRAVDHRLAFRDLGKYRIYVFG